MYSSYFQIDTAPFAQNPDTDFLWFGKEQERVIAVLREGVREQVGLQLLIGGSGAGKTTLLGEFMAGLGTDVLSARIVVLGDYRLELYNAISKGLGLEKEFGSKVEFLVEFSHFLKKSNESGKRILLVVDDAQGLGQELLEELRMLSNIEHEKERLVCIVLSGNSDFGERIKEPENSILRKRIGGSAVVSPLGNEDVGEYIRHRLQVAGGDERLFTREAVGAIRRQFSGGYAEINEICECCLLAAASKELPAIDADIVEECVSGKKTEAGPGSKGEQVQLSGAGGWSKWLLVGVGGLVAVVALLYFNIPEKESSDKVAVEQSVEVGDKSLKRVKVEEPVPPEPLPVRVEQVEVAKEIPKEVENASADGVVDTIVEQPEVEPPHKESKIVIRDLVVQ